MPAEDFRRDARPAARVPAMPRAASGAAAAVEAARTEALGRMTTPNNSGPRSSDTVDPAGRGAAPRAPAAIFTIGDLVALRSDPDTVLPIVGVVEGGAETRYRVFRDGRQTSYYESQLRPVDAAGEPPHLGADELRAFLTSLHLLSPSTANLYSLRSGRVQFVPYQYRPVLRLIRADRPRLLIADEVGVGKTIEAGLIVKELRARTNISSVLVICPKALVTERKWFVEMKRFDERFDALDTAGPGAALRPPGGGARALLPDHHRRLPPAARAAGVPELDPARGRAAAAHRPRLPQPLTRGTAFPQRAGAFDSQDPRLSA